MDLDTASKRARKRIESPHTDPLITLPRSSLLNTGCVNKHPLPPLRHGLLDVGHCGVYGLQRFDDRLQRGPGLALSLQWLAQVGLVGASFSSISWQLM